MIRAFLRLVLVLVVLLIVGAYFFGYWSKERADRAGRIGTSGSTPGTMTDRARQTGAEIGEQVGSAADRAGAALEDARLTAKIMSKMALDDLVRARGIDVDTKAGIVTVSGRVQSTRERDRALQLARETNGVRRVTDRLQVQQTAP
jgi:hyperosmotically inducible periplasmic protein